MYCCIGFIGTSKIITTSLFTDLKVRFAKNLLQKLLDISPQ